MIDTTPSAELAAWLAARTNPARKQPRRTPSRPAVFKLGQAERAQLYREFSVVESGASQDHRTGLSAASVDEWLELKHSPAWQYRPYKAPKLSGPPKLTAKQRTQLSDDWARAAAEYKRYAVSA